MNLQHLMAMVGLFACSSLRVPMFVVASCPRLLEEVAVRLENLLSYWRSCCVKEHCHSVRPYSSWSTQALCPDWLDISNSIWILQTVTGYKFYSHPPPRTVEFTPFIPDDHRISGGRQAHKTTQSPNYLTC